MSDWMWRRTERILSRHVPAARLAAVLGDLAEDYLRERTARGHWRATFWLVRETRSLARAYRHARRATSAPRARYLSRDELVHAWRALRGRPGIPALCTVLLGLGIGLVTAMFSVMDSMLIRPVPFHDPDRLVRQGFSRFEPAVIAAWQSSGLFESVEAVNEAAFTVDGAPGVRLPGASGAPSRDGSRPRRGWPRTVFSSRRLRWLPRSWSARPCSFSPSST